MGDGAAVLVVCRDRRLSSGAREPAVRAVLEEVMRDAMIRGKGLGGGGVVLGLFLQKLLLVNGLVSVGVGVVGDYRWEEGGELVVLL